MSLTTVSTVNKYLLSGETEPPIQYETISDKLMFLSFEGGTITDHWGGRSFVVNSSQIYTTTQAKFGTYSLTSTHTANTSSYAYTTNTMFPSSQPLTVAFWLYLNPPSSGGDTKAFEIGGNDKVFFWGQNNSSNYAFSYGTVKNYSAYVGTWVHLCATITTNGIYNVYINGAFDHTFTDSSKVPSLNSRVYIGASTTRAHRSVNGYIDHFKLWSKVLTAEEVGFVYNNIDI